MIRVMAVPQERGDFDVILMRRNANARGTGERRGPTDTVRNPFSCTTSKHLSTLASGTAMDETLTITRAAFSFPRTLEFDDLVRPVAMALWRGHGQV